MARFRPRIADHLKKPVSQAEIRTLLLDVLAARHFFVGPDVQLEFEQVEAEDSAWEIFQGRLLEAAQTRQRATFAAWNVFLIQEGGRSGEPLLSLKLDTDAGLVHVVRGLECYVWEGYDAGGNVFLSRERRKWVRELVDTLHLDKFADLDALRDEIICSLFHAVVGTSRLPLTSVEAPLPLFSFGELFYCCRSEPQPAGPWRGWQGLLDGAPLEEMGPSEKTRWLEAMLRASGGLLSEPTASARVALSLADAAGSERTPGSPLLRLLLRTFNDVSLSPYHDLGKRLTHLLDDLARQEIIAASDQLDFLASLLIQLGRHLTAYDLITFHHRGANYPDALLLDDLLKTYLGLIEQHPELLTVGEAVPKRRRALRQAWLLRRFYEGHLVPDAPTSPGENNRVLPGEQPRVPEEQILQTSKRRRKLYDGDPLPGHLGTNGLDVLRQSVRDLQSLDELRELGLAVFLDRPLGDAKSPAEPDRTPLMASLAFSRTVARQRLQFLKREPLLETETAILGDCLALLETSGEPKGLPVQQIGPARRPSAVSLADARRAAPDFVFLRTLPGTLVEFLRAFALQSPSKLVLLARAPGGDCLVLYDEEYQARVEVRVDASAGYAVRANKEYPVAGLLVRKLEEGVATEPVRLLWRG